MTEASGFRAQVGIGKPTVLLDLMTFSQLASVGHQMVSELACQNAGFELLKLVEPSCAPQSNESTPRVEGVG